MRLLYKDYWVVKIVRKRAFAFVYSFCRIASNLAPKRGGKPNKKCVVSDDDVSPSMNRHHYHLNKGQISFVLGSLFLKCLFEQKRLLSVEEEEDKVG